MNASGENKLSQQSNC